MLNLMKKYMSGNWGWAVAAPLFMLLEVAMDLMQPALMAEIIDVGVANGDVAFIFGTGRRMLCYAVIGLLGGAGCVASSSIAAVGFAGRLRQSLFDHIQTFSFTELDTFQTSSLITRLTNDVTQIQQIVMMALRLMVRAPLMSLGGIFMAYRLSPSLSLILAVSIPFMLGTAVVLMKRAMPMFMVMQTKVDRINGVMRENLLGVKVVKSFVSQDWEKERFGVANKDLTEWGLKAMQNVVILFPVVSLVMNLSVVAVLWFGGSMAISARLETGRIMAFANYLIQIMSSMMMVVMMSMAFIRSQVAVRRLNEVLDTESSVKDGVFGGEGSEIREAAGEAPDAFGGEAPADDGPAGYDIEFRDVSFRHHNSGEWVLKHIDLKIEEGKTIGIIGPTGGGKSTLVSLIPRLYEAVGGQVLVGGSDVREYPLDILRRKIGMVLQESILFAGTVEENLRYGKEDATEEELKEAAADAQALDFILEKENGFQTRAEQRGRNFSGGQKQRLSIARTLLRRPQILILDDAASAVDMVTESKIREAVSRRTGTCTLIIIAQRVAAVKDADLILVMNEGEIAARGTHRELLEASETYRRVTEAQMGEEVVSHAG